MERLELEPRSSPFRGGTVLVTGHTGFTGSWLSLWLRLMGAEVVGVSLDPPSRPNLFEAIGLGDRVRSLRQDIRDFESLAATFAEVRPEVVFHLAAQPIVRQSYREPRRTFETNVLGTVNVLEAARLTGSVRALVNVTSDKCYENDERGQGHVETDRLGGAEPYSASKACAELVAAAYLSAYPGLAFATARAGNIIGGGDWGEDRLVPDCVRAFSRKEPVILRYPEAVRPWQHVLDAVAGYLVIGERLLAEGGRYATAWNLGPSGESFWTVEQVVRRVCRLWDGSEYKVSEGPHPPERGLLALDSRKARAQLGWRTRLSTERAIEATVLWYREFYSGADAKRLEVLCVDQIREAEKLIGADRARAEVS